MPCARTGQFILCLFVFIPRLSFYEACEASIFYYIAVILRQDCHVASYLDMGAKTVGCGFAAGILAGIVVCLPSHARLALWHVCASRHLPARLHPYACITVHAAPACTAALAELLHWTLPAEQLQHTAACT